MTPRRPRRRMPGYQQGRVVNEFLFDVLLVVLGAVLGAVLARVLQHARLRHVKRGLAIATVPFSVPYSWIKRLYYQRWPRGMPECMAASRKIVNGEFPPRNWMGAYKEMRSKGIERIAINGIEFSTARGDIDLRCIRHDNSSDDCRACQRSVSQNAGLEKRLPLASIEPLERLPPI